MITDDQMELYLSHVNEMFEQMGKTLLTLSTEEQAEFFKMLTDHVAVLRKLLPGYRLLKLIDGEPVEINSEVHDAYQNWVNSLG